MRGYGDLELPVPIDPGMSDPGIYQPPPLQLPDLTIPGVTMDDTGMPVVTIVGSRPTIPTWLWIALAAGILLYLGGRK